MAGRHRDDIAMQLVRPTGVIFKHLGNFQCLDLGITDRFAGGDGFQQCQIIQMIAHLLTNPPQDAAAFCRRHPPPDFLPGNSRLHCGIHHLGPGILDA